jgi:hypothetical protein
VLVFFAGMMNDAMMFVYESSLITMHHRHAIDDDFETVLIKTRIEQRQRRRRRRRRRQQYHHKKNYITFRRKTINTVS